MSDETRDLAQRIETALKRRAETDADGFAAMTVAQKALDRWRKRMAEGREAPMGEVYLYDIIRSLIGTVQALRATDDALLLDALARIEEDGATIATLRERVEVLERETHTRICRECSGIGTVSRPYRGDYAQTIVCPTCAGRGTVSDDDAR